MTIRRSLAALALAAALGAVLARAADPATSSGPLPAAGVVDGATAQALAGRGARLVDVRTPQEFAAGHVPGAVNVPYDEIERRSAELGGPETPLVLYCRSGRRSGIAAEALRRLGYQKVWDMQRFTDWPEAK